MAQNLVLSIDSVISLLSGLPLFFFPQIVADSVLNRPTDGIHWHLCRCIGGQLLASSFFSWRLKNKDIEVKSSCFVMRLISSILCALVLSHIRSQHPQLIDSTLLRNLVYCCLFLAIFFLLFLVITGWPIGETMYAENKIGNILYHFDTVAATTIGVAWIMEPKWLLHRQVMVCMFSLFLFRTQFDTYQIPLDESHELCGRIMGTFFMASQVISSHALHWKSPFCRTIAAETRGMCCLFILAAQIWSQIFYKDWSDNHWVGISLFSCWTLIAIIYRTCIWYFGECSSHHINAELSNGRTNRSANYATKDTLKNDFDQRKSKEN